MKRINYLLTFIAALLFSLLWINCNGDDNPTLNLDDPATLSGTYDLVSWHDKIGDIGPPGVTYTAGETTEITEQGTTVSVTITGTLVLTETTFTVSFSAVFEAAGAPPQTETDMIAGSYTINGSAITFTDNSDGSTSVSTISVDGNRLTIDDADLTIIFEKR